MLAFYDFPLSVSQNRVHTVAFRQKRIIKSGEARMFDQAVFDWKTKNQKKLDDANCELLKLKAQGFQFQLDMYFCFSHSRLWTKKGGLKQLDTNNFMKSAIDGISKCLNIDDSLFFSHFVEKVEVDDDMPEHIIFVLKPVVLRSRDGVIDALAKEIKA